MTCLSENQAADRAFLLTRPSRDVTGTRKNGAGRNGKFLLTRPSRDVTDMHEIGFRAMVISTHTSLAGRDRDDIRELKKFNNFYSHVPRGT